MKRQQFSFRLSRICQSFGLVVLLSVIMLFASSCSRCSQDDADEGAMPEWIEQTVSFLEDERKAVGDSIRMSRDYYVRLLLRDEAQRVFRYKDRSISLDGSPATLLNLMNTHGALTYDAYRPRHGKVNYTVLARKIDATARSASSSHEVDERVGEIIDNAIEYLPKQVFLLGYEYTPLEFAHSIALADDYVWLTPSDAYPIDSLLALTAAQLAAGHPVLWQGTAKGKGVLASSEQVVTRQLTAMREHNTPLPSQISIPALSIIPDHFQVKSADKNSQTLTAADFKTCTIGVLLRNFMRR